MTPQQKAEACAAVARSATLPGEREAAWGRLRAICQRHGLDEASFRKARRVVHEDQPARHFDAALSQIAVAMHDFARRMEDIVRFQEACDEAAARDAAREAAAQLRKAGIFIHRLAPNEWLVPGGGDAHAEIVTDAGLLDFVDRTFPGMAA